MFYGVFLQEGDANRWRKFAIAAVEFIAFNARAEGEFGRIYLHRLLIQKSISNIFSRRDCMKILLNFAFFESSITFFMVVLIIIKISILLWEKRKEKRMLRLAVIPNTIIIIKEEYLAKIKSLVMMKLLKALLHLSSLMEHFHFKAVKRLCWLTLTNFQDFSRSTKLKKNNLFFSVNRFF